MRIALDGTPLVAARTGVGWYTAELVQALARTAPSDEILVWPITWRRQRPPDDVAAPNVTIVGARVPARLVWGLRAPLERFVQADVFHATNFLAPAARTTPVVVTVHDLTFVRHPRMVHPRTRRDLMGWLPDTLRRAAAIIAISQFTADELLEWHPQAQGRVHVVHQGPHRWTAQPGDAGVGPGPYALFVGTLDPRKNIELLLDAVALLKARGTPLRAVLAGGQSPLVDVTRLAADRGLTGDDVVLTGYADDARLAALYRDARVFAFPSRYEGFGLPLVEAMAAGVPVVAASAASTPEVVGDAALLGDPDDAEAFAGSLHAAATDDAVRARLTAAGTERARRFNWNTTARATRRVYEAVVTDTSPPRR